jgi:hypothetical protein
MMSEKQLHARWMMTAERYQEADEERRQAIRRSLLHSLMADLEDMLFDHPQELSIRWLGFSMSDNGGSMWHPIADMVQLEADMMVSTVPDEVTR